MGGVLGAMHWSLAEEMPEVEGGEPVLLTIAVVLLAGWLVLHGEETPAMPASSAVMLQEFSSGGIPSAVFALARAPVAPGAILGACGHTSRDMTCSPGVGLPVQERGGPLIVGGCRSPSGLQDFSRLPAAFFGWCCLVAPWALVCQSRSSTLGQAGVRPGVVPEWPHPILVGCRVLLPASRVAARRLALRAARAAECLARRFLLGFMRVTSCWLATYGPTGDGRMGKPRQAKPPWP